MGRNPTVQSRARGRPKLPKGEERSELLRVRVRPHELQLVNEAAKRAGKSLADYVRDVLLGSLNTSR
jgi:predicted HicB family RNase H-like nuclease